MDISTIKYNSPDDILEGIAQRVKARRLEMDLTQKGFAKRSGIGYDAYRKFENSGEITLRNLVLASIAFDDADLLNELFTKKAYSSIDEILKDKNKKKRQRASKK